MGHVPRGIRYRIATVHDVQNDCKPADGNSLASSNLFHATVAGFS